MARIAFNPKLGRPIRQDEPDTLGVSTLTLAEEAARAGRAEEAVELMEYFRQETAIMHDFLVAWINDLLGFIAERCGEDGVLEATARTYEKAWKKRYELWDSLTTAEKLQLSVEGMRGHLSGPRRRGDVEIREELDRWVLRFDPCGSGGALRRAEAAAGRGADPDTAPGGPGERQGAGDHDAWAPAGTNQQPHGWTWGKTGVHWYCTHCCIVMEYLTARERGTPLRPLDHNLDPHAPCTWYIYKDERRTRPEHFLRIGLQPPDSSRETEDR